MTQPGCDRRFWSARFKLCCSPSCSQEALFLVDSCGKCQNFDVPGFLKLDLVSHCQLSPWMHVLTLTCFSARQNGSPYFCARAGLHSAPRAAAAARRGGDGGQRGPLPGGNGEALRRPLGGDAELFRLHRAQRGIQGVCKSGHRTNVFFCFCVCGPR